MVASYNIERPVKFEFQVNNKELFNIPMFHAVFEVYISKRLYLEFKFNWVLYTFIY